VVRLDHLRAGAVAALDVIGKTVLHARIDVELADSTGGKLALEPCDE
jgi:hypothetical protein